MRPQGGASVLPTPKRTIQFEITYEGEHLIGHWPNPPYPRFGRFWLAPLGAGMFHPVQLEEDELFDVVTNLIFEFTPLEGQATKFELRSANDDFLVGSAERER